MKRIFSLMIRLALAAFMLLVIISPIYFLIIVSLFSNTQITSPSQSIIPDGFNIGNFLEVIRSDSRFYFALGWTILFALLASLLKTIILVTGGFGLSLMKQKTRLIISLVLMFFMSIPEIILYTGLYKNTISWDLKQSVIFLPLSAPLIFSFFSLMYFQNAFLNIGEKFSKMVMIDRLSVWDRIVYMYLPKIQFSLIVSAIFSLIYAWNSFLWPNIILPGTGIIFLGQWFRTTGMIPSGQLENLVAAGAIITMIIPLIFYWSTTKWVNRSFTNPVKQNN
ncbi:multiple sugar transport system permease protein [Mycoplasmoides fastidiosum]|uniref:Multiple sugar transport system permease protein n=1 Tax=Mycoplasmoides fastidiosum TaxID=92758 RepID=A0ABU0LZW5_9BACT|nr:ABC transporter permease subunit [Mycoplasmoides fastidiosum]MDQ0514250.1 multiple sugar transport system permease protein [Mycoplasmoides fastidiosum]UUD37342.1 ABC transporter permease subunit [Mycoplasmoides fastidiosum]